MEVDYAGIRLRLDKYMKNRLDKRLSDKEYVRGYKDGVRSVNKSLSVKTDPINYTETKLHFVVTNANKPQNNYEEGRLDAFKIALNRLIHIVVHEI